MNQIAKSWKTSSVGIIGAALVLANLIWPAVFTKEINSALGALLIAAFGLVAKDHNVSGNPPVNIDETK